MKFKRRVLTAVHLNNANITGNNIVVNVSPNSIKKGQEIFVVAPSRRPRTLYKTIRSMKEVIVRAKVEAINGNSMVLSSVPENKTVVEAKPIIDSCLKKSVPVYVESIERW